MGFSNVVNAKDGIFLGKFMENYNLEFDSLKRVGLAIVVSFEVKMGEDKQWNPFSYMVMNKVYGSEKKKRKEG